MTGNVESLNVSVATGIARYLKVEDRDKVVKKIKGDSGIILSL